MKVEVDAPQLPFAHLRCSTSDALRPVVQRAPAWSAALPVHQRRDGDEAVVCYRVDPQSFFVEVRFRRLGESWAERDFAVVPGSVVELRLALVELRPEAVTQALDLPPTRAWAKGDTGPGNRRFREEGLWIHEVLPRDFLWPEEKIAELCGLLKARPGWRDVVGHRGVAWAGVAVHFHGCQEHMGGLALDAATLEDLVALSLQLDAEIVAD
jgi:hypothetical protein